MSLRAGPAGSCCLESKIAVTLTAGVQPACVFLGPHVVLHCEAYVFTPVHDSGGQPMPLSGGSAETAGQLVLFLGCSSRGQRMGVLQPEVAFSGRTA